MNDKAIPSKPSLELDRKRAKRLLKALRSGDAAARSRFAAHHPRAAQARDDSFALVDAQLVIAREYGFPSWPRWKAYVEMQNLSVAERAARLISAACRGDMRQARGLLDAEPTLARFDLGTAVCCGESDVVERLLQRDPTLARKPTGPEQREPLLIASFSRFLRASPARAPGIVRCAELLLSHGADPNASFDEEGDHPHLQTCLYGAAGVANDAALTRLLIDAGAELVEEDNETLYHAAEFADVTCLKLVLALAPPVPEVLEPLGEGPQGMGQATLGSYCLGRALDFENEAAALVFLERGADPNQRVPWNRNRSHLHKAAVNGRSVDTVRRMLECGGDFDALDADGVSAYRHAVSHGHSHLVELFEAHGADPASALPSERRLALVLSGQARPRPHPKPPAEVMGCPQAVDIACRAASLGDAESLRRLLDAGAPLEPEVDLPPVHAAAWFGQLDCVRVLVERGVALESQNAYGGTPLGAAVHGSSYCMSAQGGVGNKLPEEIAHGDYPGVVQLLLEAGAKPPSQVGGSDAVEDVLRRWGVPEAE